MELLELPFVLFHLPEHKLKLPKIPQFSPMTIFVFAFASYFLVLSGIVYDIIVEPPAIGTTRDPASGQYKPEAFMKYRVNGQFIIEGLSAGILFTLGAVGVILLDLSNGNKNSADKSRYILLLAGVLCVVIAYNVCILFLKIKIPGYGRF